MLSCIWIDALRSNTEREFGKQRDRVQRDRQTGEQTNKEKERVCV